ncbi:hypothetical protein SAMN05421858_4986 [Haladaptatus litoreus]|uniref:DUF7344 domain-containing protein n=1 Tax=Haladaptatus litoreus TaxID=553468 RepID=A0A1N7FE77_9EURY|nr:hypothetical protein [Haladaptatus litoreus]SIR98526.1 hypothetical protein SAMN05421858_4986 [Haladaptatus litoreus]
MLLDDKFSVLASSERRQLLHALTEDSAPDTVAVSPTTVATNGGDREHAITLHHVHLPRLEDHGLITWDQKTDTVTKGPQFAEIEPLLTDLTEKYSTQFNTEPPD